MQTLFTMVQMPLHNRTVLCAHSHCHPCTSQPWHSPGMLLHIGEAQSIWLTVKGAIQLQVLSWETEHM